MFSLVNGLFDNSSALLVIATAVIGYYLYSFFLKPKSSKTNQVNDRNTDLSIYVFYNPLSGGFSKSFIKKCSENTTYNIVLISMTDPDSSAFIDNIIPSSNTRIVICGGDGTVGWVFDCIRERKWDPLPPVCLNPSGTGNDLAKAFNCSFISKLSLDELVTFVSSAEVYPLDRWVLATSSQNRYFNNYLGFGVDAVVAYDFQYLRSYFPFLFLSPSLNLLWYVLCIVKELIFPSMKLLDGLSLVADGREIDCSAYMSVLLLNIPFFCGGGNPIGRHFGYKQCCDKEIEIVGFSSIPHILLSKFGFTKGYLLGKFKHVEWKLRSECVMEADGEPWNQEPSSGSVEYSQQVGILVSSSKEIDTLFYDKWKCLL